MGFFQDEEPKPIPIQRRPGQARAMDGARGCDACPLQVVWRRVASGQMEFKGDGDLLLLGPTPDYDDDTAGAAFHGKTSKPLRDALPSRHLDRIVYGHLTRCHPGASTLPSVEEIHCCGVHLEADIAKLRPRAILGFGQVVLSRFFPGAQLRNVHGLKMPVKVGDHTCWFVPVFDLEYVEKSGGGRGNRNYRGITDTPAYPSFQSDIRRFFANVDDWPTPHVDEDLDPRNILLVEDEDEARQVLAEMEGQPAIDLETIGLRPYNTGARLLIGSVSDGVLSMAFPVDHPEKRNAWALPLLLEVASKSMWTAHNAAFEYMWLAWFALQAGIPFEPQAWDDTMAMARLRYERETVLSLEDVSTLELGVNVKQVLNVKPTRILEYPLWEQLQYCGLDTMSTAKIRHRMLPGVLTRHARNYDRLIRSTRVTSDMTLLGLDIDGGENIQLQAEWSARMQEAEERVKVLYEVRQFEKFRGERFEISNPLHVGIALVEYGKLELPRTAGDKQYSTDDTVLRAAAGGQPHPVVDGVLEYREAAKIKSTYLDVVTDTPQRCVDERLHPGYTTMLTATLRLSSEDPNIQNWPKRRHAQIRRQVIPDRAPSLWALRIAGQPLKPVRYVFVKFDYKALEARVIAMASKDRNLCESTIKRVDIHARWRDKALAIYPAYIDRLADRTNETETKLIMKGARDIIKTDFVFASFYGATPSSCSTRTGIPLQHVQELAGEFWREFYGVKDWIKQIRNTYRTTASSTHLTGIVRRAVLRGNEPINNPIQASGAAIVAEAMNALGELSWVERDPYLHPRIQIHDDLTFVLPDDERLPGYIERIAKELIKVRFDWQIVPLSVEAAIGDNWADMVEFADFEGSYNR